MKIQSMRALRAAFWRENPRASRRLIPSYDGAGRMYCTDTRAAFCEWLDSAARDGRISENLAQRATLKG